VAMMSMTVLGVVQYVQYDLEETISLEKASRARQLAGAGVAIGLHPLVNRGDPLLNQTLRAPDEKFEVHLHSEGGRLNINTIVQSQKWQVLHDLCSVWGMQETDTAKVVSDFQTWTKPDKWEELESAQTGVREIVAPGQAASPLSPHLFRSLAEMLMVPGINLMAAAKPDWQDYFTVWSDGKLDMTEAPADLIMAVCGVGSMQAQRFVNVRLGPDGRAGTDDDVIFHDMEQVRQALGMPQAAFEKIQDLVSLQDSVTRIESMGSIGTYQQKVIVVCRRNSNPPVYFLWQEQ